MTVLPCSTVCSCALLYGFRYRVGPRVTDFGAMLVED